MSATAMQAAPRTLAAEWQRRRAELTHDWLQNRALAHVAALLAISRGDVDADDDAIRALTTVIFEWRERREDVAWLTEHVVAALSPVNAIGEGRSVNSRLFAVSEDAWRRRHAIDELVASIRTIAFDIDRIVAAVTLLLRTPARNGLMVAAPSLLAFAAAAREMLAAFRRFPPRGVL